MRVVRASALEQLEKDSYRFEWDQRESSNYSKYTPKTLVFLGCE